MRPMPVRRSASRPFSREADASLEEWAKKTDRITWCSSTEFWYDHMESQSGRSLPVIYRPFDLSRKDDWRDEGMILDFVCATQADGTLVLDFGPGDGWPSLRIANMTSRVVGVDASERRVRVCRENARRLGIGNTEFLPVPSGARLPFEPATFDAAVAASSIEQTPSPMSTLRELYRVLKPGGRLRLCYEGLARYLGGRERTASVQKLEGGGTRLELFLRSPDDETAMAIHADTEMAAVELEELLCGRTNRDEVDEQALRELLHGLSRVTGCRLQHPGGATFARMLKEVGFTSVAGTQSGAQAAERAFTSGRESAGAPDHGALRRYLRPIVESVVRAEADLRSDPWITAVK